MTKKVQNPSEKLQFSAAFTSRRTTLRAIKVSSVVGTILIAINQGDLIAAGSFPPFWKILLTYFVPYCVSSYSTAMLLLEFNVSRTSGLEVHA